MADIDNDNEKKSNFEAPEATATGMLEDGITSAADDTAADTRSASEIEAAENAAIESIEWNADAADLAFAEADEDNIQPATEEETPAPHEEAPALSGLADALAALTADNDSNANDERTGRLQELARRVAQTVSERKNELSASGELPVEEMMTGPDGEPTAPDMEQMGFQALEEELDAAENDADPEPTEFVDNDQLISIIESMLFSTDKPVSTATIKALFKGTNIRTRDIQRALDILASEYASATRGVSLEEINGGYQLRTKVDNAEFLKRLAKSRPFRLSGPALEVMSIVAYKQPVSKHEVDEIRGVESGHLLRALMERGMVSFQGKSETLPGKPMTYGSTRKFLETFGLRNLRELPTLSEIDELLPEGIGEVEEKEKLSDITDSLSNDFTGGYSEGEEELAKINDTLSSIDTSSEFFEQEKVRERERRDRERAQDIRERLVMGDAVETKDQRWLDRYEAKLIAVETAAAAGTPGSVAVDLADEQEIGTDLEALSSDAAAEGIEAVASTEGDDEELQKLDAALSDSNDSEEASDSDDELSWDGDDQKEF